MVIKRVIIIVFLILSLFSTIIFEFILNTHPKIILLECIQSPLTLINIILIVSILLVLFSVLLIKVNDHGVFIIYMTFLKFFESILPLIDLMHLLYIYHYKTCYTYEENSITTNLKSTKIIYLSLIFAWIRLIINMDFVRRRCNCKRKRQVLVIFDLFLFILISISLIRYSSEYIFRTGQKIILGILIFQLNDLFYNELFWINLMKWNKRIRQQFQFISFGKFLNWIILKFTNTIEHFLLKIIHLILIIRWIIGAFIVYLFLFSIFRSKSIAGDVNISYNAGIFTFLKVNTCIMISSIIFYIIIHWDTLQSRRTLNQYGVLRFCIGIDFLPGIEATERSLHSTRTASVNFRSSAFPFEQQTCLICYDDKDLNNYTYSFANSCQHPVRSICKSCLFNHVQKTFQVTFTDDIYCPEPDCHVKLDYDIIRNIFLSNGDRNLIDRYDRYILNRQLEQMDDFIWCSNPSCNVGQVNEDGAMNNIVTCFNCHQKTCFTHKVKWHEGLTCEAYDKNVDLNDESSRRWIVENSKKCPKCPYQIEKSDGCDHIKCIKCHHEFCWSCLADFQPIRQYGNHRHNQNCKHYAPYDEEYI
ncbi:unnamed protein product [Adineta steineri]|uniref:RBR-type E3 ubiquitin transferase n=1 Tax=Adineta steineri TaxID=433720 RepID=A0A814P2H5_9BILA|nr:unnamed protein product [Adineta steineri]